MKRTLLYSSELVEAIVSGAVLVFWFLKFKVSVELLYNSRSTVMKFTTT